MPTRRDPAPLLFLALALLGAALVQSLRGPLAETVHNVRQKDDVYLLPPPSQLRTLSLGYHATMTDLVWAMLLVEYGTHWAEKRPFEGTRLYADAILALEPDYAPLYRYIGTLLAYRPLRGTEDDVRTARSYLERGLRERARDHHVWMEYGQFIAFIAPTFLTEDSEKQAWRKDGASAMAHAVELGGTVDRSVAAATILSKQGERQAAIRYLQRAYAMTDENDPRTRDEIREKLVLLEASRDADLAQKRDKYFERERRRTYPFLSKGSFLMLGPVVDTAGCVGKRENACSTSWSRHLEDLPDLSWEE